MVKYKFTLILLVILAGCKSTILTVPNKFENTNKFKVTDYNIQTIFNVDNFIGFWHCKLISEQETEGQELVRTEIKNGKLIAIKIFGNSNLAPDTEALSIDKNGLVTGYNSNGRVINHSDDSIEIKWNKGNSITFTKLSKETAFALIIAEDKRLENLEKQAQEQAHKKEKQAQKERLANQERYEAEKAEKQFKSDVKTCWDAIWWNSYEDKIMSVKEMRKICCEAGFSWGNINCSTKKYDEEIAIDIIGNAFNNAWNKKAEENNIKCNGAIENWRNGIISREKALKFCCSLDVEIYGVKCK